MDVTFHLKNVMYVLDTFKESDLQCIHSIFISTLCVMTGNRTHDLGVPRAMLYQLTNMRQKLIYILVLVITVHTV